MAEHGDGVGRGCAAGSRGKSEKVAHNCTERRRRREHGMYILLYFGTVLAVLIVVVLLPVVSGVLSYRVRRPTTGGNRSRDRAGDSRAVDVALNATTGRDVAAHNRDGLQRRVLGHYSEDPSVFDYDVDELIAEELAQERRDEELQFAEQAGKDHGKLV
ncbi:AaceriAGR388Wp [[Ashbya] aceris (nom. inval.)]|nr:AaceriAGR388Wp [[Ashbya] aceris (nom. inval.)]